MINNTIINMTKCKIINLHIVLSFKLIVPSVFLFVFQSHAHTKVRSEVEARNHGIRK